MNGEPVSSTERDRTIERACSAPHLDAAYIVLDFNKRCVTTREAPIALECIITDLPPDESELLTKAANALSADEGYIGEKHWTGRPHEQIYAEMRDRHPGFGQASYELALHRGIISMR